MAYRSLALIRAELNEARETLSRIAFYGSPGAVRTVANRIEELENEYRAARAARVCARLVN